MTLSHTKLGFTSRSSTTSFVFPSFPVPATTFGAGYWKKLRCGVNLSLICVILLLKELCLAEACSIWLSVVHEWWKCVIGGDACASAMRKFSRMLPPAPQKTCSGSLQAIGKTKKLHQHNSQCMYCMSAGLYACSSLSLTMNPIKLALQSCTCTHVDVWWCILATNLWMEMNAQISMHKPKPTLTPPWPL